jgi:malonyl-CoA decarboxylase
MSPADWLSRSASLLRPALEPKAVASLTGGADPLRPPAPPAGGRSTRERLQATLRRHQEALSPRVLRRTLLELQSIVDPRVSEVEGGRRARGVAGWYANASAEQRRDCWLLMSEQFAPDPEKLKAVRE